MFSGCTAPESTELGSSDQEASPSAGTNTGIVLTSRMGVCPYSYFRSCGYFWGPWVSFVTTDDFPVRVTKITSRIGASWIHSVPFCFNLFLTQWNMATLSKGCKLDNFESHNSLKLSFTNISGLRSNFVECESFLESYSPEILAVWDKLGWLYWFWQFICERLSSFNLKGFYYSYAWS